jgi:hypothetical protein
MDKQNNNILQVMQLMSGRASGTSMEKVQHMPVRHHRESRKGFYITISVVAIVALILLSGVFSSSSVQSSSYSSEQNQILDDLHKKDILDILNK